LTVLFERANESGRNAILYSERPLNFTAKISKSLHLGGVNNWTRQPIEEIKKGQYDLIVINGWRTLTERNTISYLKRRRIPFLFYINGGIIKPHENAIKAIIKTGYIQGASHYFCPDENSFQYLVHYGADPKRISIYPYSSIYSDEVLPSPYTDAQKSSLRKHLKIEGGKIFVSTGQFIKRKNFAELIDIWRNVPKDWILLLIGEGKEKKRYQRKAKSFGLSNMILMPFVPHKELLRIFRACDAFVFLSKEDIYGHVINEALSQGLPVVSSSHVNAARHLIKNGYDGYLVELNDRQGIEKAISETLEKSMQINAINVAKENTLEVMARYHEDKFVQILKEIDK